MPQWRDMMDHVMRDRASRLIGYGTILTGSTHEAEDLLHDALLKTFSRRRRFEHVNQAESYVRSAMRTLAIDKHRSADAQRRAYERSLPDPPTDPLPDGDLDVWTALTHLPPRERVCVVLRYFDDLSVAQISHYLNISEGAVKRYLFQARATLADHLDPSIVSSETTHSVPVVATTERKPR